MDAADYVTWRENDTANAALPNDNNVGNQAARYSLWRSNFGNQGAGSGLSTGTVPEPGAFILMLIAAGGLAGHRRRAALVCRR